MCIFYACPPEFRYKKNLYMPRNSIQLFGKFECRSHGVVWREANCTFYFKVNKDMAPDPYLIGRMQNSRKHFKIYPIISTKISTLLIILLIIFSAKLNLTFQILTVFLKYKLFPNHKEVFKTCAKTLVINCNKRVRNFQNLIHLIHFRRQAGFHAHTRKKNHFCIKKSQKIEATYQ